MEHSGEILRFVILQIQDIHVCSIIIFLDLFTEIQLFNLATGIQNDLVHMIYEIYDAITVLQNVALY